MDPKRASKLADIGCIVCRNLSYWSGPCEIHHLLTGKGMGQKNPDELTIGLCYQHHRGGEGIHTLGKRTWEDKYGLETDLLQQVDELIS